MAKTMAILKAVVLVLVLVPLVGASSVEELERKNEKLEAVLAQLTEMFSAFQAQMEMNVQDFTVRFTIVEDRLDIFSMDAKLNDTEDLEARVSALEESMVEVEEDVVILQTSVVNLADEVDNVESANLLQDDRINTLEDEIFDNENDIEELVETTTGLTTQVVSLEQDVTSLDQRVSDLESGGGGSGNVTDLEARVETLEEVTSQLTDDVSSLEANDVTQDEIISGIEEDVASLEQRVDDLESSVGGNITDYGDTAFLAALSTSISSSENPLIFDWDVINPGGHYSTETGKYTAPYDGIYQFSVQLQANDGGSLLFEIHVDNSAAGSHDDAWYDNYYRSTTILLELQAGQTVHVREVNGVFGSASSLRSYFCGYMISAN